ncbi:MAG TPA: UDP-glucose 4-epimerase GalE [Chitinophagaceae bacterium]|jgi:UDP-glucose 4-epimerase|nr:UDP-glucose 4-epimerase GalE [Chitinophagaceae bacterium]HMX77583.1 UDP-glucose 4-epimerase GalE [Chitinophagaceae bacterium]HNA95969.1 UDP-glucose 4-epimerase GalE [Chitinophagaceae bacterium]HNC38136.1 UDP-glucose 4-epimerase GalE [Chitinophagaceae bacterium]HNF46314.1 UDP-glucose 4-epimerase GalE [Chitinophagaceae bacterium]
MSKILVTGGCGYIGSHTIVDLIENGYELISVDNNSRSTPAMLHGAEQITGKKIKNYKVDLCNFDDTHAIFQENKDISGIIHFAAYKAVGESVGEPLLYYENNIASLVNLLKCVQEFQTPYFVFSSSCSVYGNTAEIPVTETTPLMPPESPYGATKQMGEQIISDFAKSTSIPCILLRYFNPAGAHPSTIIGEMPLGQPSNLVPVITQTAIGKIKKMTVFGTDYDTRDGSCIRDFIHVCDLAHAHTLALKYLEQNKNKSLSEIFNLGTGNGVTVLEAIQAFEKVSGVQLNFEKGARRPGDVVAIYANNDLAKKQLGWETKYHLDDIMLTAWKWEQKMKEEASLMKSQSPELN